MNRSHRPKQQEVEIKLDFDLPNFQQDSAPSKKLKVEKTEIEEELQNYKKSDSFLLNSPSDTAKGFKNQMNSMPVKTEPEPESKTALEHSIFSDKYFSSVKLGTTSNSPTVDKKPMDPEDDSKIKRRKQNLNQRNYF